jgi:hypothetical protein
MQLMRAYAHRFGPGKTHVVRTYPYTECGRTPHAEMIEGDWSDVDCKHCRRAVA